MAAVDKAQDKSREKHKRFRSDRYTKMLERRTILRECETVSALAKAEAILRAEKEYLSKHGVRVNWPGKKALEEAYEQTIHNSSLPASSSSTSISYSSNIQIDSKPFNFGGSLPASPKHTPLHKAPAMPPQYAPPPLQRLSLASASPICGNPLNADNSFNFSFNENSPFFAPNVQLTSTPIAKVQQPSAFTFQPTSAPSLPVFKTKASPLPSSKPLFSGFAPSASNSTSLFTGVAPSAPNSTPLFSGFAPSASNSTDSGKFSDAEITAKTPQSDSTFTKFVSTKPLFGLSSTTTVTSLPSSTVPFSFAPAPPKPQQAAEPPNSGSTHKIPTRSPPTAPIVAAFKPPKSVQEPEAEKPNPIALRWLRLQRDYYRRFVAAVKEFTENPKNTEMRRMIKMEAGYIIDRTIQKRPTDKELDTSLAEFSRYFSQLLAGEPLASALSPNKTFLFDPKNEGPMNYLIDIICHRIIDTVKQDPSLMDIAKLAHAIVASKIPAFRKIFRQSLTNFLFLIQLTSDDLLVTLDEKLNEDAGYFSINCLENDKHLFRFLCILEMTDNTQVKNLSDLCGIRLLYELCNACNILPQVPVTTLSIIFEVMQTAGPALTAETSPYRKEFIQMVFPRLRFLVSEDMTAAIDGITVRLADPEFRKHLQKMHAIVVQRVLNAIEKIGMK